MNASAASPQRPYEIARAYTAGDPVCFVTAKPEDAAFMAQLDRVTFVHPWPQSEFFLQLTRDRTQGHLAFNDGHVVGYYLLQNDRFYDDSAHINCVGVVPAAQGHKVGEQVMLHALEQARQTGAACCFLEVDVTNVPAKRLYEKCGFQEFEILPGYYVEDRHDGCRMVLPSLQSSLTAEKLAEQKHILEKALSTMHPYPAIHQNCKPE